MKTTLAQQSPIVQDPADEELSGFEKDRIQAHIEQYGHQTFFSTHECSCGADWKCRSNSCRKPQESQCKKCEVNELLEEVRHLFTGLAISNVSPYYTPTFRRLAEQARELEVRDE